MKTNFLYGNALLRGSGAFLKMVTTVIALFCCLVINAQPIQTAPTDNANVTVPVILEWTTSSIASTDIEIYECSNNETALTNIDLNGYQQQAASKALSVPAGQIAITDLSGVTYSPVTGTLFMITNKGPGSSSNDKKAKIYEYSVTGSHIRTIDLISEDDTEDIVHLYGNTFAVAEEKKGEILLVNISDNTTSIDLSIASSTALPNWSQVDGDGVEGVTYNPDNGMVYCVTEIPMQLHSFELNSNPTSTLISNCLQNPYPFGINEENDIDDLSAIHYLRLTQGLEHLDVDDHFLLLSHESDVLIETDENCTEYSRLDLPSDAFGNDTQLEGVTMDDCGNIYIVGEPNHFFVYSNNSLNLNPPKASVHTASTSTSNYSIPVNVNLQTGTDYCWRIKSNDECIWSPIRTFTPVAPCSSTSIQACNDNNPCTTNDQRRVSTFDGSVCVPCTGTFQDSDNDGVCDADDICLEGDDNIDENNNGIPDACEICSIAAAGNGDVNLDGTTNIVDALIIAQYTVGNREGADCGSPISPQTLCLAQADMNCDGEVNIVDALLVAQCDAGVINPVADYCPN